MKKILLFLFTILVTIIGINYVKALSNDANTLLDKIGNNRKLNITSIKYFSPNIVDGSDIYDQYYSFVINSYIHTIPSVSSYLESHSNLSINVYCVSATNCGIKVDDKNYNLQTQEATQYQQWLNNPGEYPAYGYVHYDITMTQASSSSRNSSVLNTINSLGKMQNGVLWSSYYLYDLGYINFLYNSNNIDSISSNYNKIVKYFPEVKDVYENLGSYQYLYAGASYAGDASDSVTKRTTSNFVSVYNGNAYNYSTVEFNFAPLLLLDSNINDSDIIDVATNKIKNYLGSTNITTQITQSSSNNETINTDVSKFLNAALGTSNVTYVSNKYRLTLGNKTSDLYIVKVANQNTEKFTNHNSISKDTGIRLTTKGVDVPFDSSLDVADVSNNYSKDKTVKNAYDIKLYSLYQDGFVSHSDNGFNILIPISDSFKTDGVKIYYLDESGNKQEEYNYEIKTISNKKYISFVTSHLSVYAITNENEKEESTGDENPKTGGYLALAAIAFVGIIALVILSITIKRKYIIKI